VEELALQKLRKGGELNGDGQTNKRNWKTIIEKGGEEIKVYRDRGKTK
jgi:hypothetical protein